MNLDKIYILKFLKGKFRSSISVSEQSIINPHRDWMSGLGVATIIFLCAATYFGYHFYTHLTDIHTDTTDEIVPVEYKRAEIESIIDTYRERKTSFEELRLKKNITPVTPDVLPNENNTPLAEEEGGQYSSEAPTAPVME